MVWASGVWATGFWAPGVWLGMYEPVPVVANTSSARGPAPLMGWAW